MNGVGEELKPSIAPQVSQPAPMQVNRFTKICSTAKRPSSFEIALLLTIAFYGNSVRKYKILHKQLFNLLYYTQPAIAKSVSETSHKLHLFDVPNGYYRCALFQSQTNMSASCILGNSFAVFIPLMESTII